jgi:hypothetical protein
MQPNYGFSRTNMKGVNVSDLLKLNERCPYCNMTALSGSGTGTAGIVGWRCRCTSNVVDVNSIKDDLIDVLRENNDLKMEVERLKTELTINASCIEAGIMTPAIAWSLADDNGYCAYRHMFSTRDECIGYLTGMKLVSKYHPVQVLITEIVFTNPKEHKA